MKDTIEYVKQTGIVLTVVNTDTNLARTYAFTGEVTYDDIKRKYNEFVAQLSA